MARRSQITATPLHVPSLLVVLDAAWPELFGLCLTAASRLGLLVHRCEVSSAATFAAERRPLAIVTSLAVHSLDPAEFDALARDIQAGLVKVDDAVSEREIEAMIAGAMRERESRDETGRYTMIGQGRAESTLSQPPPSVRPPPSRGSVAPPSSRAAAPPRRDTPPPSVRALLPVTLAERLDAPPSSGRAAPATARASAPPPSARSAPPASALPPPPSARIATAAPPPASTRSVPAAPPASTRAAPQPSARTLPPAPSFTAPPSVRTLPPGAAGPRKADPSPRSGVRERGGEEFDAIFDDQDLPLDALAEGGRGSATRG